MDDPETKKVPLTRNPFFWATIAGLIFIPLMRPLLKREPAPPPVLAELPAFTLVDSRGGPFGSDDLAGDVYVANFIFTRCASICPLLTRAMGELQARYEREEVDVRLVSITVDPGYDTPEKLAEYGKLHRVDPVRWTLLTGSEEQVRALVIDGFKTAMGPAEMLGDRLVDIAHTGKFVLVDRRGRIRGYYDSDGLGLDEIYHRSRHVLDEPQTP